MNRKDWEDQVFASDMNPTARMVCIAIGSHGNWVKDQEVRPSVQRIAGMTGLSRDTAGKYVSALEEQGWLKHLRTLEKNIKVYELCTPAVVESMGILAIVKRGSGKVKNRHQLSNESTSDSKQLSNEAEAVVESSPEQLSNEAGAVVESYDTNLLEPTNKNLLEEPTTSDSPVADAPVLSDEKISKLGEDDYSSPKSKEAKPLNTIEISLAFSKTAPFLNLEWETRREIKRLALDPNFLPDETAPYLRLDAAVKEVLNKEVKAS